MFLEVVIRKIFLFPQVFLKSFVALMIRVAPYILCLLLIPSFVVVRGQSRVGVRSSPVVE